MTFPTEPKLPDWPFLLGDAMLLSVACFIFWQLPLGPWELSASVACVVLGAWLGVTPFVMRYRAAMKLTEADRLRAAVLQLENIEIIGRQISHATANWQNAHEASNKTIDAARQIGEEAARTARDFSEILRKANDAEKTHLRLEVEKLRRAENDWVQILIRILDHVLALYQAGVRSGQPALAEQLGQFQNACRDAARRVGLVPFVAMTGEAFDSQRHQLADSQIEPATDSRVAETLAAGYSFQGRPVRLALVSLQRLEVHKPSNTSDFSVSMISRRHGPTHLVDEPPAAIPQPEKNDSTLTEHPAAAPETESVPRPEPAPEAPTDSKREELHR
jgi:molecular chaperone GrpE (heat shock protein)